MTRARLERTVRVWQRRLGLERWDVEINWDEACDEDANAATWRSSFYDRATIRWAEEWREWSPRKANEYAVHELLHLHLRDVDVVIGALEGQLHRDSYSLVDGRYEHEVEGLIERLTYRLIEIGGLA